MSAQFEPKDERGNNKEAYDSFARLFADYTEQRLLYAKHALDKLKAIDEKWAEQGEP